MSGDEPVVVLAALLEAVAGGGWSRPTLLLCQHRGRLCVQVRWGGGRAVLPAEEATVEALRQALEALRPSQVAVPGPVRVEERPRSRSGRARKAEPGGGAAASRAPRTEAASGREDGAGQPAHPPERKRKRKKYGKARLPTSRQAETDRRPRTMDDDIWDAVVSGNRTSKKKP